jgi:hypothetical protein
LRGKNKVRPENRVGRKKEKVEGEGKGNNEDKDETCTHDTAKTSQSQQLYSSQRRGSRQINRETNKIRDDDIHYSMRYVLF